MLIAQLTRYYPFGGEEPLYAAADPFDNEQLTQWHLTIKDVEAELEENTIYGLNLAAYAGESDVPARPSEEEWNESQHDPLICNCPAIPCN